jgi:hypothetical protein
MLEAIRVGRVQSRSHWALQYIASLIAVEEKREHPDGAEIRRQVRKLKRNASKGDVHAMHFYGEYLMMPKLGGVGGAQREAFEWWEKAAA